MTNHVHLIAVPRRPESLARGIGRAHQAHTRRINRPRRWTGHLWANRFYSTPLDAPHLWTAVKYVELNPVRARMVARAAAWPWSSAAAHAGLAAPHAVLAPGRPFPGQPSDAMTGRPISWAEWLAAGLEEDAADRLRLATSTGRPMGDEPFVARLESELRRTLAPQPPGPKPQTVEGQDQLLLFE